MKSISKRSEGVYKEKGSKFYAFAFPCTTVKKAKNEIKKLRDLHPKAVHVCFAWRIGFNPVEERFSDDGEPNNSAGKPIFGQLTGGKLTNILVAVVRYYGGTKLGVGGLVSAYKTATKVALDNSILIEAFESLEITITFHPKHTSALMYTLNNIGLNINNHSLKGLNHQVKIQLPKRRIDEIMSIFGDSNIYTIEIDK